MKLVGGRRVFSVEEVTARLAGMFEDLRSFWVEAEVQDLRPAGSQMRFSLRGEHVIDASMSGVLWERLAHRPADGTLVQAYGRMQYWRPRSQLSMRVERLELAGEGLLRARVAELRARLEGEGLLDPARKRRPPMLPRRIGLVTSPDGAARDDVLTNLWARFPAADVLLMSVPVQGDAAPGLIVRALEHLDAVDEVEVIVVARGGGSLEDLMAFNSEAVCRAVAGARTPVVSAVGHERDVTLCDLVADVRVSTPTAAAAAVVPSAEALAAHLDDARAAIARGLVRSGAAAREALGRRSAGMLRALRGHGALGRDRVDRLAPRLEAGLARAAARAPGQLEAREAALGRAAGARVREAAARVERAQAMLGLLSPARTVARGYAIVRSGAGDRVIGSAAGLSPGDRVRLELRDGAVGARVEAA
ncbi:exodeoxyribonuclease VII large subunit [Miltoncostaea marina]|uniref:exodeoxyribonuclease VII large subunit n=1 Tax=Miltoncostaea marina TaxID=2843215 RepID=UPI001C3D4F28|nr:exodeoxyribonuclease VII large subunit [Miltoncostaea marina]